MLVLVVMVVLFGGCLEQKRFESEEELEFLKYLVKWPVLR